MKIDTLDAISPIDGRYWNQCNELSAYFSEAALIRYRLQVEVEYLIALAELPLPELKKADAKALKGLRKLYVEFSPEFATNIKDIEKKTNHDVKALEYFLKERLGAEKEFVHFGLTSQDINNTAFPLLIKECVEKVFYPLLDEVIAKVEKLS